MWWMYTVQYSAVVTYKTQRSILTIWLGHENTVPNENRNNACVGKAIYINLKYTKIHFARICNYTY